MVRRGQPETNEDKERRLKAARLSWAKRRAAGKIKPRQYVRRTGIALFKQLEAQRLVAARRRRMNKTSRAVTKKPKYPKLCKGQPLSPSPGPNHIARWTWSAKLGKAVFAGYVQEWLNNKKCAYI